MLENLGEWHLLPVSDKKLHVPNNDVLVGIACEVAMRSKVRGGKRLIVESLPHIRDLRLCQLH